MPGVRHLVAIVLLIGAGGCAQSERGLAAGAATPGPNPAATRSIATAAAQIKRCYRAPRVAHEALQIATRIHVRFAPDGTLAALPSVVAQSGLTPVNQAYAGPMGEAAVLSVIRCAPLTLPAEAYAAGWQEFELTFSPKVGV